MERLRILLKSIGPKVRTVEFSRLLILVFFSLFISLSVVYFYSKFAKVSFSQSEICESGLVCIDEKTIGYFYCEFNTTSNSCECKKVYEESCGDVIDSDGGDNPNKRGNVIVPLCVGSSTPGKPDAKCVIERYRDQCTGICDREILKEYYIEDNSVKSRVYSNLFENNQYCKKSVVYTDFKSPSLTVSPAKSDWTNRNIYVSIICDDYDESGCKSFSYTLIKIV